MSARINTCLIISGDDFDPVVCSSVFHIKPSSVSIKGVSREKGRPPAPTTEWVYETDWMIIEAVDEGVKSLFEMIRGSLLMIKAFCVDNHLNTTVVSVVEFEEDRPVLGLSRGNIDKLSSLGAEYYVDLYDFSS